MVNALKRIGAFFLDIIQTIVLALSLFIIIYLFLLQPHQVRGSSMYPSFYDGEFLLTDKISYRFGEPRRGDVIIFKAPPSEPCAEIECEYIKRIIGMPGDKVVLKNGKIFINGQLLDEKYLPSDTTSFQGNYLMEGIEKEIPAGEYLPLGDNRSHSRDGREFGAISRQNIIGKAWLRYWPIKRWGLIPRINY